MQILKPRERSHVRVRTIRPCQTRPPGHCGPRRPQLSIGACGRNLLSAAGRCLARRRWRLGRDPLPERGREHRAVRHRGAARSRRARHRRRGRSSSTTAPTTAAPSSRGPPARASSTSPAAATAAPTSPASRPPAATYIVMVDADLTYDFEEIPRFVARARRRRRARHGQPDGEHPAGRDAVAEPLHRQPAALRGFLNLLYRTRVRDAHCGMRAVRRDVLPRARPAHRRDGVRLGDGDPRVEGSSSTSASSRSRSTRAAASRSSRRSATAGATCA